MGFLPHNINPARIFIGGYRVDADRAPARGINDHADRARRSSSLQESVLLPTLPLPLILPPPVIAVPLLDVGLAVIRRTGARRSPLHRTNNTFTTGYLSWADYMASSGWADAHPGRHSLHFVQCFVLRSCGGVAESVPDQVIGLGIAVF